MEMRRAGQHARATTRRLAVRALVAIVVVTIGAGVGVIAVGLGAWASAAPLLAAIAVLWLIDRYEAARVDRWDRGATGEEHVGAIIDGLAAAGWLGLHDVELGRGNIDHVLVGPAGVLTVETKSHGGRIGVDRIDERMLRQAYAQSKALERIVGAPVSPLLVFSRAFLDRPISRRRGVTILPARLLAGHLDRRQGTLSPPEVSALYARLAAALTP